MSWWVGPLGVALVIVGALIGLAGVLDGDGGRVGLIVAQIGGLMVCAGVCLCGAVLLTAAAR